VTTVDPSSAPVVVDEAGRRALARCLGAEDDVIAVYLFGSQSRGTAGPLSDVDVAVWLDTSREVRDGWPRAAELTAKAAEALRTSEVQVVVLNEAPPLLAHRVLRDGVVLFEEDARARVAFETSAILRYLDTIPLREELSRALSRRLSDGSYGRPRSR
jgi:predicted nucleotidyltransferase